MKRLIATAAMTALGVSLAGCGTNEEAAQNGLEATPTDDANGVMANANNPFADAEMQMNDKMMAAVGSDAGDTWARKMIEHHQGAIDMSRIALEQNLPADVATMAREGVEKQQKEIEDLRKLLKDGAPNAQSAELYRPAMMEMHQKMQAASGANPSETFMRKMLEHHRGGVTLSDAALQNGVSGALRQQVQKTRDDQQKETRMVEAMLRGQSHHKAMEASGAKSAEQAKSKPAPAEMAKSAASKPTTAAPKPAPKPAAKPAEPADPHAGHDMNNM